MSDGCLAPGGLSFNVGHHSRGDCKMVVILKFLSATLLVVGLVVCAVYLGHEAIRWREARLWPPQRLEILFFSASCVAVAMVTLALLEIRDAIAGKSQRPEFQVEPLQNVPQQPAAQTPQSPMQGKIDVRKSYLDIQDR